MDRLSSRFNLLATERDYRVSSVCAKVGWPTKSTSTVLRLCALLTIYTAQVNT